MFKLIFRVALAFAAVWMLAPHGSDPGLAQRGYATVQQYMGWQDTPDSAVRAPPKRRDANGKTAKVTTTGAPSNPTPVTPASLP
ncbi:hypothetical protein GCM10008942_07580 [Rhizomicrobium electricum]|uniref:Uncharacterized protein n=1 Tax=Rhizomicrobium electricum TaxID=480070 RepID=A0ABP3P756_9PROT